MIVKAYPIVKTHAFMYIEEVKNAPLSLMIIIIINSLYAGKLNSVTHLRALYGTSWQRHLFCPHN
jgi:hypothetical protein